MPKGAAKPQQKNGGYLQYNEVFDVSFDYAKSHVANVCPAVHCLRHDADQSQVSFDGQNGLKLERGEWSCSQTRRVLCSRINISSVISYSTNTPGTN